MNEFLRNFIMKAIRDMINNNVELYKVYQYATGWYSKNVLLQEDLQEIETLYIEKENTKEVNENIMNEETLEDNVEITETTETNEEVK